MIKVTELPDLQQVVHSVLLGLEIVLHEFRGVCV